MRPPRLVGRAARARRARRMPGPARRAFVLLGEAGIGKSRLLQDFASPAARVVVGSGARPGDAGIAYALLARLLRAVLAAHAVAARRCAQAGARARPARARRRRSRLPAQRSACCCIAQSTRRWPTPLARACVRVIVDDLHFADDASVEFLQSLIAVRDARHAATGVSRSGRPRPAPRATALARGARGSSAGVESIALAAARPGADDAS